MSKQVRKFKSDLLNEDIPYSSFDLRSIADSMDIQGIESISFETEYQYEYSAYQCYEKRVETEQEMKFRIDQEERNINCQERNLFELAQRLGYKVSK